MQSLEESVFPIRVDRTYRRQTRHIVIASVMSTIPLNAGDIIDPSVWGAGSSEYTWGRVRKFFTGLPIARHGQLPMHYYMEYLNDDYVSYVGCPLTNKSWFLEAAVSAGVLPIQYLDSVLIVLQENFGIENVERRCWKMLANDVVTPLMRMLDITRERVAYFELLANREAINGPDWNYMFREPTYLDPLQFDLQIKEYEKR